jgi:undecaprenyl-diphosphatase
VLVALMTAFVPAAIVGVALESVIKDRLFGVGPVSAAWIVGGIVILVASRWLRDRPAGRITLEQITVRMALIIGVAQVLALWPGTSRSLVTILAALFLGMSMPAALEFSFLLGLATLSAATLFEALKNGGELIDTYGLLNPIIGFVAAFVSAVIAVRWLVGYLSRHGLELFGWYRIVVGVVAIVLLVTGVL